MTSKREQLKQRQAAAAAKAKRNQLILIGVAVTILAVLIGVISWAVVANNAAPTKSTAPGTPPNANSDASAIVAFNGKAKPGAPVVDLYVEYQCGACHQFEQVYGAALDKLAEAGEIKMQYHTLLFHDNGNNKGLSTQGAVAAACSDFVGDYPTFHRAVFTAIASKATPQSFRDQVPTAAGITGEKLTEFQACFDTQRTLPFVTGVDKKAYEAGVNSTPTLVVNGKKMDPKQYPQNPEDLGKVIKGLAG